MGPTVSRLLANLLFAASAAVLALSIAGAVMLATTVVNVPGLDELQRQGSGPIGLLILAAGVTGAGVLAGLGAIVRGLGELIHRDAEGDARLR
jgi:hypothetical protein